MASLPNARTAWAIARWLRYGLNNTVETPIFGKASLLEMKQDLPSMEKLTPRMCASMHRRDIHRHLTSNAWILLKSSLSGQHFVVMAWFWALTFLTKMLTASHIFECWMNVFPQLAIHFNNQYWDGLFRGLWRAQDGAPAHHLVAVRDCLNEVFCTIMWNGHLACQT